MIGCTGVAIRKTGITGVSDMADPWEMEWEASEAEGPAPWELEYEAPEETAQAEPWAMEWGDVSTTTFNNLSAREGVGDTLTDVPTGAMGVTKAARRAVGDSGDLPDEDVARLYLNRLSMRWGRQEGYNNAPPEVQEAILDASYNMGEQVLGFDNLNEALKAGDYSTVAKELLDTASVDGKTVKGLAKRRAELYNGVAEQKITEVEQLKDGTIIYRSGEDEVLRYKTKGGKHEKSSAGIISIDGV